MPNRVSITKSQFQTLDKILDEHKSDSFSYNLLYKGPLDHYNSMPQILQPLNRDTQDFDNKDHGPTIE